MDGPLGAIEDTVVPDAEVGAEESQETINRSDEVSSQTGGHSSLYNPQGLQAESTERHMMNEVIWGKRW